MADTRRQADINSAGSEDQFCGSAVRELDSRTLLTSVIGNHKNRSFSGHYRDDVGEADGGAGTAREEEKSAERRTYIKLSQFYEVGVEMNTPRRERTPHAYLGTRYHKLRRITVTRGYDHRPRKRAGSRVSTRLHAPTIRGFPRARVPLIALLDAARRRSAPLLIAIARPRSLCFHSGAEFPGQTPILELSKSLRFLEHLFTAMKRSRTKRSGIRLETVGREREIR